MNGGHLVQEQQAIFINRGNQLLYILYEGDPERSIAIIMRSYNASQPLRTRLEYIAVITVHSE